ncbi:hypothetical protein TNCV_3116151 [Trichonephila clavipes]|nr:hypothetical protein TNCV_3116151 [Trichonephila clavipes]
MIDELVEIHEQEQDIEEHESMDQVQSEEVPSRHGDTLNSRRAANPLVSLVEGEERWEAPSYPQGFPPLNWGGTE